MTTVSSVSSLGSTSTSASSATVTSDYEMFLQLLTTQMQNQDPTNPLDSSDYAVQLATFSQVEQQVKTNELLENLAVQLGLMGMSEYASWVGMEARAEAPGYFDGVSPVSIAPNPVLGATETILVIEDAAGQEVARQTIPVSADTIEWNGTDADGNLLPPGLYSFSLESYNSGTLISTDPVETYNRIMEAQGTASGAVLLLRGGTTIETGSISALRDGDSA